MSLIKVEVGEPSSKLTYVRSKGQLLESIPHTFHFVQARGEVD